MSTANRRTVGTPYEIDLTKVKFPGKTEPERRGDIVDGSIIAQQLEERFRTFLISQFGTIERAIKLKKYYTIECVDVVYEELEDGTYNSTIEYKLKWKDDDAGRFKGDISDV